MNRERRMNVDMSCMNRWRKSENTIRSWTEIYVYRRWTM